MSVVFTLQGRRARRVFFDRNELNSLLSLYSRRVMSGEWRDYAIDHGAHSASFSIFRHTAERPLYCITKSVAQGGDGAVYTLMEGPKRLKRARTLGDVLSVLDRRPYLAWRAV